MRQRESGAVRPDVMRTPECKCLECGALFTALGTADESVKAEPPGPGEFGITVCIKCGAVMALNPDLTVRPFTEAEMDGLIQDVATMDLLARMVRGVHLLSAIKN